MIDTEKIKADIEAIRARWTAGTVEATLLRRRAAMLGPTALGGIAALLAEVERLTAQRDAIRALIADSAFATITGQATEDVTPAASSRDVGDHGPAPRPAPSNESDHDDRH